MTDQSRPVSPGRIVDTCATWAWRIAVLACLLWICSWASSITANTSTDALANRLRVYIREGG